MLDKCYSMLNFRGEIGSVQTLVCVKQVKPEMPEEEWNESMPLPGDIIQGVAEENGDEYFVAPAKGRSELSALLGKMNRQVDLVWVKVRRGDATLKLRAYVVAEKTSKIQRRFTIRAVSDDRHVAVLGDLTLQQCAELQEMSRRVVNVESVGFVRKEVGYDWKKKIGIYLPFPGAAVISSILFMPLTNEHSVDATTARSMAWLSASISSGVPLVFVNIQTEQNVSSKEKSSPSGGCGQISSRHQNYSAIQVVQGIRLWFLPGVAEVPIMLTPEPEENRFGMDIKRTDEGFIYVFSVTKGKAADRAGLGQLLEEARECGHLIVISRIEEKSLMPSTFSATGLLHCCDHTNVKETLAAAIDQMEGVHLHIMAWSSAPPSGMAPDNLRPPPPDSISAFHRTFSDRGFDLSLNHCLT